MFGHKPLSLPSPFPPDHRRNRLYSEPTRPQPSGRCHFLVLHAGSREQRCPCQGYQQNCGALGNVCDCTHAACYHAHNFQTEDQPTQDSRMSIGSSTPALLEKIRKLEDAIQLERDIRENMLVRERHAWETEVRMLKEALASCCRSEQDMQQRLTDIERKLDQNAQEQTQTKARVSAIENSESNTIQLVKDRGSVSLSAQSSQKHITTAAGANKEPLLYCASDGLESICAETLSPRPSGVIVAEPDSPRSSGILNLIELPRSALPRHGFPPRLSPPIDSDEPRSSGFLALDVKELIQRRMLTKSLAPAQAYGSPTSSTTKSPPSGMNAANLTPLSLPRRSPPGHARKGSMSDNRDRTYKKRKAELMALDVLADVSAASPVLS